VELGFLSDTEDPKSRISSPEKITASVSCLALPFKKEKVLCK
jgi:hypothetical protein